MKAPIPVFVDRPASPPGSVPPGATVAPAARRTLDLVDQLFGPANRADLSVLLWDGTRWPADGASDRRVTLVLRHPGALRAACLPGTQLALAEAYLYDDIDIVGDIELVFALADRLTLAHAGWRQAIALACQLRSLPPPPSGNRRRSSRGPAQLTGRLHSIERDRKAVTYHYDVSNDFYALWLDPRMVYSCAYFRSGDEDLAVAQEQKLAHVCRKLRLRSGQRLLDIGCGWGGLAIYAAERLGVDATGITLSEPQVDLARQRITTAGLADRCRIVRCDYREAAAAGPAGYDALVSVGMSEHVGAAALPTYFRRAWDLLKPGGVFLNHAIGSHQGHPRVRNQAFDQAYVFPDSETVPIGIVLQAAEAAGFEVRDVENLREHYATTLRHWVRRLETRHEAALAYVGEPTYRVWRTFMSGSAYGFATGRLNVYQALFLKPNAGGRSLLPLTRDDWYAS
jgi:cyclopropane-fatty-acyl-phospholipid synthase